MRVGLSLFFHAMLRTHQTKRGFSDSSIVCRRFPFKAYENVERCLLSIARTTMILTSWPLGSIRCPEAASSEKHVC